MGYALWKKDALWDAAMYPHALWIQQAIHQIAGESLTAEMKFKLKDEKIAPCEELFGKCWR